MIGACGPYNLGGSTTRGHDGAPGHGVELDGGVGSARGGCEQRNSGGGAVARHGGGAVRDM